MGFRIVNIKSRSKLDLKMNYLVCRSEKETRVFIPEISMLILESTSISITTALISAHTFLNFNSMTCVDRQSKESRLKRNKVLYNRR